MQEEVAMCICLVFIIDADCKIPRKIQLFIFCFNKDVAQPQRLQNLQEET